MRTVSKPVPAPELAVFCGRLRWSLENILANDGHRLNVSFACTIKLAQGAGEQKLFDEVFGSSEQATPAAIIEHFQPALRAAAEDLARSKDAHTLLSAGERPNWTRALQAAANEVGFMCGLEVLAPFEVEVTSPSLQGERLEQMQRIAAERRSADRVEHLARAAELLKQWESLKAAVPSITPGKLLEQVNPADRGVMLDTLLMAGASSTAGIAPVDLWAVSGPYLVRVDIKVDNPQPQLIPLPSTLGPLRSVRGDAGKLLIGARSGVMIVDPAKPDQPEIFAHPTLASEHGFTFATRVGDHLWACHREGGLCGWLMEDRAKPQIVISPTQLGGDPKNLCGSGLFCVGGRLCRIGTADSFQPVMEMKSPILAILPIENQILLACEDGSLSILDRSTLEVVSQVRASGRLSGAALLPWLSSSRLLLSCADGPIECIGLEDQLVTQFSAGHTGMRSICGSIGKVAAMSSDRQRLLVWNAWEGRKTVAEIYITGLTHHRVADVALA